MDRGPESDSRLVSPLMKSTPVRAKHNQEHDSDDTESPQTRTRSQPWAWWWETLAIVASLLCMAGIVIILVRMNNRPLTNWTFFLSLPATIAVFSTAAKSLAAAAIGASISQPKWLHFRAGPRPLGDFDRFEEASRGPMGSLKLVGAGPWGLVTIGALATVLALGFDVFIQQLVRLDPRDVAFDDGRAVLGLSHDYITGAGAPRGVGVFFSNFRIDGQFHRSTTTMLSRLFSQVHSLDGRRLDAGGNLPWPFWS